MSEPFSHAWRRDPFPGYRTLRDETPVYWSDELGGFAVTRFDDVQAILKEPETFSSKAQMKRGAPSLGGVLRNLGPIFKLIRQGGMGIFTKETHRILINEDGEIHRRMRDLVRKGFTPRRIAVWEERAREIVSERIEALSHAHEFDLVEEFNAPLPITIIAEMLGVEAEHQTQFKKWSDIVIVGSTGPARDDPFASGMIQMIGELRAYTTPITRDRRKNPQDDLISVLVSEENGEDALTEREVFVFIIMLLVAGNETTTNLLSNTVTALYRNPDQLQKVIDDPKRIPDLVEEALRYESPVQMIMRKATRDVEVAGTRIPEGSLVLPVLGSANRDERRFDDPDSFDIDRDTIGHLGLGHGAHFCLGASLARLEAQIALETLVPHLPRWNQIDDDLEYLDSYIVRGVERLRVRAT